MKRMIPIARWTRDGLLGLLAAAALTYLGDLGAWRMRGAPMAKIEVTRFVVASLKGSKEEYYPDGTAQLDCSRSLFPQAGDGACWWIQRHRVVFDR